MMQNILVVAPTNAPGSPVAALMRCLQTAGYAAAWSSGDTGLCDLDVLVQAFAGRPPDCLIVDLSGINSLLPVQHARRVLRRVWGDDLPLPACLCLLSPAHLSHPDWTAHADDFLLPPYAPDELIARLKLLRFRRRQNASDNLLRFADVVIDLPGKRALDTSMQPLPLTPREYDLLAFLLQHRGKFFGRDRLLDLVWGVQFEGGERTVDIHIRRLRAKLPPQSAARLQTRRGTGYGFEV